MIREIQNFKITNKNFPTQKERERETNQKIFFQRTEYLVRFFIHYNYKKSYTNTNYKRAVIQFYLIPSFFFDRLL